MYQGKFSSDKRGATTSELLQQRKADEEAEKSRQAAREAAKKAAAARRQQEEQDLLVRRRPQPRPADPRQQPGPRQARQAAAAPEKPVKAQKPPKAPKAEKPVKSHRKGTLVFYSFYFSFIFLFFVATFFGLQWLHGWLSDYEQAQPDVRCAEIFEQLFAHPDWSALYDQSGSAGTAFEGKDAYVAHMEQKVGGQALTYQETSAGLSGGKKYFFKLGEEKLGWFSLKGETTSDAITAIPDWELDHIELFLNYDNSYRIQAMDGHNVYVNGVPLDDSYTIQKVSTLAEDYLPAGTVGVRMCTYEVNNLMAQPVVTVFDDKNNEMPVVFDEEKGMFIEQTKANTISEEQQETALNAVKAYAKFMIEATTRAEVAKYFDASSETYKVIVKDEKWMQANSGYDFTNEKVADFCMYSDELFSARVQMSLDVTRKDGTVKPYPIDTTLFFELQNNGKWLAYDMTNEDVMAPVGKVRLTFMNDETTRISSDFYPTDAKELDTPMLSVPEGKTFTGWVVQGLDEQGQKIMTVMFEPDETGHVILPAGNVLKPMTLYPLFE